VGTEEIASDRVAIAIDLKDAVHPLASDPTAPKGSASQWLGCRTKSTALWVSGLIKAQSRSSKRTLEEE